MQGELEAEVLVLEPVAGGEEVRRQTGLRRVEFVEGDPAAVVAGPEGPVGARVGSGHRGVVGRGDVGMGELGDVPVPPPHEGGARGDVRGDLAGEPDGELVRVGRVEVPVNGHPIGSRVQRAQDRPEFVHGEVPVAVQIVPRVLSVPVAGDARLLHPVEPENPVVAPEARLQERSGVAGQVEDHPETR